MSNSSSDSTLRADRLRALTFGRAAVATGLFGGLSTAGRGLVDPETWPLLSTAAIVYVAVQVAALVLPRRRPGATRPLAEVALLVDVAALAIVLAGTGGVHSPLTALLLTQVVAVTLLFGRWAGLRTAVLGSLAITWLLPTSTVIALASGVAEADPALATASDPITRGALLLAVLWATTLVTGWLSTVTERDLRGRAEDLTLLRDITPDLDPRQGPDRVAQAITEVVVERLGHAAAALWLPRTGEVGAGGAGEDEDGLVLTGRHGTRLHPSLQDHSPHLPADHDLLGRGHRPTIRSLPRHEEHPDALELLFGPQAPLLVAPLVLEGRGVGLLAIEVRARFGRRPVVRARQLRMLRMLTEQATLLLDNARLQAELADQATRDAVTGLPNHRFFQQRLGEELDRVARRAERGEARAVSLALLDLDRFKAVNDTYGHPTGDRVLAAIGQAAATTLRDTDVVCRYGGEEFAVVLVDTDAEAARISVERLRAAIRALRIEATDGRTLEPITASVGIATVTGERIPRAVVVDRADAALYTAKGAGRDRAVHHDDLPVVHLDELADLERPTHGDRPDDGGGLRAVPDPTVPAAARPVVSGPDVSRPDTSGPDVSRPDITRPEPPGSVPPADATVPDTGLDAVDPGARPGSPSRSDLA